MTQQAGLRTIVPDDLFRLEFLQSAQLSPDGITVVYAVSHVEKDKSRVGGDGKAEDVEGKEYVTLWLLSLETGHARQLTGGLARDSDPRWSPDGKQIAFLSTRGRSPRSF